MKSENEDADADADAGRGNATYGNVELNQSGYGLNGAVFSLSDPVSYEELWHAENQTCRSGNPAGPEMTKRAYITLSEALVALLAAYGIGKSVKWGSSALLTFLLGHHLGDDPSNWDLIRLISFYSGIVAGALFVLWLLGRRHRTS